MLPTPQNGEKLSRGLKLLGLCSFGYIKDRESLINDNPNEFNYVRYNSNQEIVRGDNVPLNGDHTHFLLVDDGSRYRFLGGYTDFITRFETFIRDPEPKVSVNVVWSVESSAGSEDLLKIAW